MKNSYRIMEVELPHPEAAELTTRAAKAGVPTAEFLGIQVLTAAFGVLHPLVIEFKKRDNKGISGTETLEAEDTQ